MSSATKKDNQPNKFRLWLDKSDYNQSDIARICKVSRMTVSRWYNGVNNPGDAAKIILVKLSKGELNAVDLMDPQKVARGRETWATVCA